VRLPIPEQADAFPDGDLPVSPPIGQSIVKQPIVSNGGATSYYDIPAGASQLNDIIEHKEMGFARGEAFKALYRLGEKDAISTEYDLNKIEFFVNRMRGMVAKGKRL